MCSVVGSAGRMAKSDLMISVKKDMEKNNSKAKLDLEEEEEETHINDRSRDSDEDKDSNICKEDKEDQEAEAESEEGSGAEDQDDNASEGQKSPGSAFTAYAKKEADSDRPLDLIKVASAAAAAAAASTHKSQNPLSQIRAPHHLRQQQQQLAQLAQHLDANENNRKRQLEAYFHPYKSLEMKPGETSPSASAMAANGMMGLNLAAIAAMQSPDSPPSRKKARKGVQSFSIDDILSHKTAELQRQQLQQREELDDNVPQAIVRPWDIGTAAAAASAAALAAHQQQMNNGAQAGHSSGDETPGSTAGASSGSGRRKSVGDSPLDALFQMASKTFEGLKAKSGKRNKRSLLSWKLDTS